MAKAKYRIRVKIIPRNSASIEPSFHFTFRGADVKLFQRNREGQPYNPADERVFETDDSAIAEYLLQEDRLELVREPAPNEVARPAEPIAAPSTMSTKLAPLPAPASGEGDEEDEGSDEEDLAVADRGSELRRMRLSDLRKKCRELGVGDDGSKELLISRIVAAEHSKKA